MKKTISIDGKRYRLVWVEYHGLLNLQGPGLVGGAWLPAGVTLNSPREVLADAARVAIAEYRQRRQAARESLSKFFKNHGH